MSDRGTRGQPAPVAPRPQAVQPARGASPLKPAPSGGPMKPSPPALPATHTPAAPRVNATPAVPPVAPANAPAVPVITWSSAPPPIPPRTFSTAPPPPDAEVPPIAPIAAPRAPAAGQRERLDELWRIEEIRREARGLLNEVLQEALAPVHFALRDLERRVDE